MHVLSGPAVNTCSSATLSSPRGTQRSCKCRHKPPPYRRTPTTPYSFLGRWELQEGAHSGTAIYDLKKRAGVQPPVWNSGDFALLDGSEPDASQELSDEFRELCQAQMDILASLLHVDGRAQGELRATVYARVPLSFETGALQLQRVASWGPAAADSAGRAAAEGSTDSMLVLGANGPAGTDHLAEESLVREQLVKLPDSGGLVLPLAHGHFLVGLLVVERSCLPVRRVPAAAAPSVEEAGSSQSGMAKGQANELATISVDGMTIDEYDEQAEAGPASRDSVPQPHTLPQHTSWSPHGSTWAVPPLAVLPEPELFSTVELHSLKTVARVLAMACALDQRAALERAESMAGRRRVRGLVEEARGPLSALRTLGAMLVPRLDEGDPDRDMAEGIMVQGNRLQEVVSQLQAALHPQADAGVSRRSSGGGFRPVSQPALPEGTPSVVRGRLPGASQGQIRQLPQPGAADMDDGLPSSAMLGTGTISSPSASSSSAGCTQQASSRLASLQTAPARGGTAVLERPRAQTYSPVASSHSSTSLTGSAPDIHASGADHVDGLVASVAGECKVADVLVPLLSSLSSVSKAMQVDVSVSLALTDVPAQAVTSLAELASSVSPPVSAGSGGSKSTSTPSVLQSRPPLLATKPRPAGSSLTALCQEQPQEPGQHASAGPLREGDSAPMAPGPVPLLLPRPARPLVAAVSAGALQLVLSHLLDGALQRTPRGGQVSVSAHAGADGGVEVRISDSGRSMAHRLAEQMKGALRRQGALAWTPDRYSDASSTAEATMRRLSAGLPAGSGAISLAIAQRLVDKMGGTITVQSCDAQGLDGSAERAKDAGALNSSGCCGTCVQLWVPGPTSRDKVSKLQ